MATVAIIEKVAISQFPKHDVVKEADYATGLVNGQNATFKLEAIANLVTKKRLNIDKVQNLSPSEMPVSDLTQAELNKKMDKDAVIDIPRIEGLEDALAKKLDKDGTIEISQVTDLPETLEELKTGQIDVDRIDGLDAKVNDIIDGRDDLKPQVIKGPMVW